MSHHRKGIEVTQVTVVGDNSRKAPALRPCPARLLGGFGVVVSACLINVKGHSAAENGAAPSRGPYGIRPFSNS